jgi:hypothetical protein
MCGAHDGPRQQAVQVYYPDSVRRSQTQRAEARAGWVPCGGVMQSVHTGKMLPTMLGFSVRFWASAVAVAVTLCVATSHSVDKGVCMASMAHDSFGTTKNTYDRSLDCVPGLCAWPVCLACAHGLSAACWLQGPIVGLVAKPNAPCCGNLADAAHVSVVWGAGSHKVVTSEVTWGRRKKQEVGACTAATQGASYITHCLPAMCAPGAARHSRQLMIS